MKVPVGVLKLLLEPLRIKCTLYIYGLHAKTRSYSIGIRSLTPLGSSTLAVYPIVLMPFGLHRAWRGLPFLQRFCATVACMSNIVSTNPPRETSLRLDILHDKAL